MRHVAYMTELGVLATCGCIQKFSYALQLLVGLRTPTAKVLSHLQHMILEWALEWA